MAEKIMKTRGIDNLQTIPGVGKSIAEDLIEIGMRSVSCLKNQNPQKLYDKMCRKQGVKIDRCLLYVMRCAVYYASNKEHNPGLLKWWHWSDENMKLHKYES